MAMKRVFRTIQMVIARSTKGSMTIKYTICLIFSQAGKHSQMRKVLANLYQQGGHFLWDSSNSAGRHEGKQKTDGFYRFLVWRKQFSLWIVRITLQALCVLSVPSISVLVTTLIWLLARSFPLKELSWSTDTMREPECFFFISTSVFCKQRDGCNISGRYHSHEMQHVLRHVTGLMLLCCCDKRQDRPSQNISDDHNLSFIN